MATARQTVPDPRGIAQTVIAASDFGGTLIRGDSTRRFLLLLRALLGWLFYPHPCITTAGLEPGAMLHRPA